MSSRRTPRTVSALTYTIEPRARALQRTRLARPSSRVVLKVDASVRWFGAGVPIYWCVGAGVYVKDLTHFVVKGIMERWLGAGVPWYGECCCFVAGVTLYVCVSPARNGAPAPSAGGLPPARPAGPLLRTLTVELHCLRCSR